MGVDQLHHVKDDAPRLARRINLDDVSVLELRDLWPAFLEELDLVRSRSALAALRRLETLAYRSASAIVSASPAFRPYLEARGVRPDAIVDAPHGARDRDLAALREAGKAFRSTHRLGERPIVLYAGALHRHYGLDSWLAAAAILAARQPDIAFVVAGGGRPQGRVAAAARSLPNLRYLGTVPRAELDGAIGAADLGLVCLSRAPSFVSVLPGKLVELMSCGVPVVTTDDGRVLAEGRIGLGSLFKEAILRRWSFEGETVLPKDPAPYYRVSVRCGFVTAEDFRDQVAAARKVI